MITSILQNPLLLVLIIIWSLTWKGLALWKAGQQQDKVWFVVLLVLNTIGILPILYLYIFSKKTKTNTIIS